MSSWSQSCKTDFRNFASTPFQVWPTYVLFASFSRRQTHRKPLNAISLLLTEKKKKLFVYIDTVQVHGGPCGWTVMMEEQSWASARCRHERRETSEREERTGGWRMYHREWWQTRLLLVHWQCLWIFCMINDVVESTGFLYRFGWVQLSGFCHLITAEVHVTLRSAKHAAGDLMWSYYEIKITTGRLKLPLQLLWGVAASTTSFSVSARAVPCGATELPSAAKNKLTVTVQQDDVIMTNDLILWKRNLNNHWVKI